jgi:hypothetical protein
MTIVHEKECIKNKQFITNNDHVLIDNFEENIEITKLKTDEEDVSKCKFNLTCFCHMSDNNKFFLFSFFLFFILSTTNMIQESPYAFSISNDSYIILCFIQGY